MINLFNTNAADETLHKIAAIEYSLRVERIVKTFGMVNANPETIKGSECITIINGFSNLMMEVYLFTISLRNIKSPITSEVILPGVWP